MFLDAWEPTHKDTDGMEELTTRQLAKALGISYWKVLRSDWPCLREGSPGRGHSARYDLQAVVHAALAKQFPGLKAQANRDVLKMLETTLLHALRTDELRGKTLPTELMALLIYERAHLDLTGEHLQEKDLPLDLLRFHNMHLSSVNRNF